MAPFFGGGVGGAGLDGGAGTVGGVGVGVGVIGGVEEGPDDGDQLHSAVLQTL